MSSAARRSGRGSSPSATPSPASPSPAPTSPRTNTRGTCFKKIFPNKRKSGLQPLFRFLCGAGALSLPLGELSPQVTEWGSEPFLHDQSWSTCSVSPLRPRCARPPLPEGAARDVRTVRSISPSVSQSSRRRSGANEVKSVFCGGVYAAKTLCAKRSVAGRHSQPRHEAQRIPPE